MRLYEIRFLPVTSIGWKHTKSVSQWTSRHLTVVVAIRANWNRKSTVLHIRIQSFIDQELDIYSKQFWLI